MFRSIVLILCLLTFSSFPLSVLAYTPFIPTEQVTAVKAKIQTDLNAKKAFLVLTRQADRAAAQPAKIPAEYGGLSQDYNCPDHNVLLVYNDKAGIHRCPVDNKQYTGEKVDADLRYYVHMKNSRTAKDLGLAFILTGDKKYASASRDILLQYAKNWPEYKNHNDKEGHGHIFWQLIDEAQFATNIAWSYNLIYPVLTVNEQQTIEKELITPLYTLIHEQPSEKISYSRAWENTALALLGFATDNQAWFKPAIEGTLGFKEHIDKGVLTTGLWYDGSLESHNTVLAALTAVAEVAPQFGYDMALDPKLKAMFTAPLTLPPAVTAPQKSPSVDLYELAYSWYKDPMFAKYLTSVYSNNTIKIDRLSYRSLFYGLSLDAPIPVTEPTPIPVTVPVTPPASATVLEKK